MNKYKKIIVYNSTSQQMDNFVINFIHVNIANQF